MLVCVTKNLGKKGNVIISRFEFPEDRRKQRKIIK